MKLKTLALLATSLVTFGCSSTFNQNMLTQEQKLDKDASVYIATPSNGIHRSHEFEGSGQQTASLLEQGFSKYTDKVVTSTRCTTIQCLADDFPEEGYYVIPVILGWDDGRTNWSDSTRDTVELKIMIYNPQGQKVATHIISSQSKSMASDKKHPEDLLKKPITAYLKSIYAF